MSKKIIYTQSGPQVVEPERPEKRRGELGEKVMAAACAGISLGLMVFVLGILLPQDWGIPPGQVALVSAVVFLLTAAYLSLKWSLNVAGREWKVDDWERDRRWAVEDREWNALSAAQQREYLNQEGQAVQADRLTGERLGQVALAVFTEHFADRPTTREAMTARGLCTQVEWNAVNKLLKKADLKRGYRLNVPKDFNEAWWAWQDRVQFEHGKAWVHGQPVSLDDLA